MNPSRPSRLSRALLTGALLSSGTIPQAVHSQQDTSSLHATVLGWSDRTWLYLLDREGVAGGRLNDQGMLMRFHRAIDDEYATDVISVFPGLGDEYEWETRENGVRYWAGSINHRDLIAGLDVKADIPLGRGWRARFRFDKEDRPGLARNVPRIGFEKAWTPGVYAFAEGTLSPLKPDMDVTVGGGWRDANGSIRGGFTVLDAFADVIYQGLVVYPGFADTATDYERQPYALRGTAERRIGRHLRVQADVGGSPSSTVRAYRQVAPDSGFRQNEEYAQAAGLVEWTTLRWLRAGAMGTWVRAELDRTPLPLGRPEDDFRLVEQTTQLGGYVMAQPHPQWRFESWLLREHRPQTKDYRTDAADDVDYEDRAWRSQTLVRWLARFGLKAEAALEMDLRDVVRGGPREVPSVESDLARHNTRLRMELGWRYKDRFRVDGGYRIDLDGDTGTDHGRFDGAHGRFVLFW